MRFHLTSYRDLVSYLTGEIDTAAGISAFPTLPTNLEVPIAVEETEERSSKKQKLEDMELDEESLRNEKKQMAERIEAPKLKTIKDTSQLPDIKVPGFKPEDVKRIREIANRNKRGQIKEDIPAPMSQVITLLLRLSDCIAAKK
jgi:hypothetical protein